MELIIEYFIQKGGVFGLLLAVSFAWIVFREQQLAKQSSPKKDKPDSSKAEVDKILYIVEELKQTQLKAFNQINNITPIVEQIHDLEKTELQNIEKLEEQLAGINSKISDVEKKTKDLWDWHSVKDSEGVPIWYVRRSLEESIGKLEKSIDSLEQNFNQVSDTLRNDLDTRLQKVHDERVNELKKILETYNKTVTDLIVALEKIKFLLKSKDNDKE